MYLIKISNFLFLLINSLLHCCLHTLFLLFLDDLDLSLFLRYLHLNILTDLLLEHSALPLAPDKLNHRFLALNQLLLGDCNLVFYALAGVLGPVSGVNKGLVALTHGLLLLFYHMGSLRDYLFLLLEHVCLL